MTVCGLRRALVFTGHRLDAPSRNTARFPATAEPVARSMIREAVKAEAERPGPPLVGISGAANGGDILFQEVCDELGIPAEVHLAKPPADYIEASVAAGGPDWIARFAAVTATRRVHVLPKDYGEPQLSVWDRSNLEMLEAAAAIAAHAVTLIALWNGEEGDGPGGAAAMIQRVQEAGGRVVVLDANKLPGCRP